jgi:hypothetical protein
MRTPAKDLSITVTKVKRDIDENQMIEGRDGPWFDK